MVDHLLQLVARLTCVLHSASLQLRHGSTSSISKNVRTQEHLQVRIQRQTVDAGVQIGATCVYNVVTDCRLLSWWRVWCWAVFRSIVGNGLSQFRSRTLNITLPFFTRFRNSEDRRATLMFSIEKICHFLYQHKNSASDSF